MNLLNTPPLIAALNLSPAKSTNAGSFVATNALWVRRMYLMPMNIAKVIFSHLNDHVSLFTLAWLLAMPATAQIHYAVSGSTAYVTNSSNLSGNIVIASTFNGYPVTRIGKNAFYGVNSMTSMTIPNSVIEISDYAFVYCWGLTNVAIGNSVATIGASAFASCSGLTSVTIPASVTNIGDFAFEFCSSLTSVTIPNSLTTIGYHAFYACSDLTSVTIPNSVNTIGDDAFYACSSLTNIAVDVANPRYASAGGVLLDKTLTTLILYPAGLTGGYAIPNSIATIGYHAFASCGLMSVTIPNSVITIGFGAFDNCSLLTSVTIPNSVTDIGGFAFHYCQGLTSVTIPSSVTNIGNGAFTSCYFLTNIAADLANPSYASAGGILFNKTQSILIQYPPGLTNSSYAIPNSVTTIGYRAFSESLLTSVTIPKGVTTIGDGAFDFCTGLTSVTVPNSVTNIGQYAFEYCYFLTNAVFQGNAPSVDGGPGGADSTVFLDVIGTVHYLPGTFGWSSTFGGWPTAALAAPPTPPQIGGSIGIQSGNFGFIVTGATNQTVVVEASTNLINWQTIWTNTLSGSSTNFSDPQWMNYPSRYYRVRSQ